MIYIKIYLDKDEKGEEFLVFDSAKDDCENKFVVAGKKSKGNPPAIYYVYERATKVNGVEQVAISPEAKALFLELLADKSACQIDLQRLDFNIRGCFWGQYGWDSGTFSFRPLGVENGQTRRILRRGEPFAVNHAALQVFEYMTPCDNERLKALDLTVPVDETVLIDEYYDKMLAKGEEPACDLDGIRRTPLRFMTEKQKEVIRQDYRAMVNSYASQEWHEHGEFLDDKIAKELVEKYLKFNGEIDTIIRNS